MADETTPSPSGGVTPTAGQPVTGTPASSPGVTPAQKPATSPEDVTARIAELERSLSNAKEENDRHSKKLSTYEKQEKEREAAKKAADEAQLSEIDRITKQHAEAEAKIKQYQQQLVLEKVINAAQKKNIIDPEMAAWALEQSKSLEFGDDGMPTNLDKALDDLIKNKRYLVPEQAEPAPTTPAQTAAPARPNAPAVPPFAGRSSIPSPSVQTPGKPFTLDQYEWKR